MRGTSSVQSYYPRDTGAFWLIGQARTAASSRARVSPCACWAMPCACWAMRGLRTVKHLGRGGNTWAGVLCAAGSTAHAQPHTLHGGPTDTLALALFFLAAVSMCPAFVAAVSMCPAFIAPDALSVLHTCQCTHTYLCANVHTHKIHIYTHFFGTRHCIHPPYALSVPDILPSSTCNLTRGTTLVLLVQRLALP